MYNKNVNLRVIVWSLFGFPTSASVPVLVRLRQQRQHQQHQRYQHDIINTMTTTTEQQIEQQRPQQKSKSQRRNFPASSPTITAPPHSPHRGRCCFLLSRLCFSCRLLDLQPVVGCSATTFVVNRGRECVVASDSVVIHERRIRVRSPLCRFSSLSVPPRTTRACARRFFFCYV